MIAQPRLTAKRAVAKRPIAKSPMMQTIHLCTLLRKLLRKWDPAFAPPLWLPDVNRCNKKRPSCLDCQSNKVHMYVQIYAKKADIAKQMRVWSAIRVYIQIYAYNYKCMHICTVHSTKRPSSCQGCGPGVAHSIKGPCPDINAWRPPVQEVA